MRLASNDVAPNQAFRYGPRAYGLQFHIEVNTTILDTWIYHPLGNKELVATLNDAEAPIKLAKQWSECAATYQAHTRALFENFLRIANLI
jgi:GMP synthase (glutamine-hydrolysing)